MESSTVPPDPVAEWVTRAASGDHAAWEQLYRRYRGLMLIAVRGRGVPTEFRGRFDTEDIVQSAFLAAFQSFGDLTFVDEPSFRTWLKRIAVNRLIDRIRHNRTAKRDAGKEAQQVDGSTRLREETPSVFLSRLEERAGLLDALADLEEEEQALVCWKTLENFTWNEIASFLGCGEKTARRRYTVAVRHLQNVLRDRS